MTPQCGSTARKLFEDAKEKEKRREKKEDRRRGSILGRLKPEPEPYNPVVGTRKGEGPPC
jgi:hypothetical protein